MENHDKNPDNILPENCSPAQILKDIDKRKSEIQGSHIHNKKKYLDLYGPIATRQKEESYSTDSIQTSFQENLPKSPALINNPFFNTKPS